MTTKSKDGIGERLGVSLTLIFFLALCFGWVMPPDNDANAARAVPEGLRGSAEISGEMPARLHGRQFPRPAGGSETTPAGRFHRGDAMKRGD